MLRLKRARNPDAVCLVGLLDKFIERMESRGVVVLLCGVRPEMAQVLQTSGIAARSGPQRIFQETNVIWSATLAAVRHAYELVQGDLCPHCPRHGQNLDGKQDWYYMI